MWFLIWLACAPAFALGWFGVLAFGMGATRRWHESIMVPACFLLAASSALLFVGIAAVAVFQAFSPFEVRWK